MDRGRMRFQDGRRLRIGRSTKDELQRQLARLPAMHRQVVPRSRSRPQAALLPHLLRRDRTTTPTTTGLTGGPFGPPPHEWMGGTRLTASQRRWIPEDDRRRGR